MMDAYNIKSAHELEVLPDWFQKAHRYYDEIDLRSSALPPSVVRSVFKDNFSKCDDYFWRIARYIPEEIERLDLIIVRHMIRFSFFQSVDIVDQWEEAWKGVKDEINKKFFKTKDSNKYYINTIKRESSDFHDCKTELKESIEHRFCIDHILEEILLFYYFLHSKKPFKVLFHISDGYHVRLNLNKKTKKFELCSKNITPSEKIAISMDRICTPYWHSKAFCKHADRYMVAPVCMEDLLCILLKMHERGEKKAFIKFQTNKFGTYTIDISKTSTIDQMRHALFDCMPLKYHYLASHPVIVQSHTPFVKEHRFFVIDFKIAASTPSIRDSSLLQAYRNNRRLHTDVAVLSSPEISNGFFDRGNQVDLYDRKCVAEMARKLRRLNADLKAERFPTSNYVVDMGETTDGRIIPIEINTLPLSGLYAVDLEKIAKAMGRSHKDVNNSGAD